MDGLPKNKKPWGKAKERTPLALDDYLFERKLQQVYDKTEASDDTPALVKKMKNFGRAVKSKSRLKNKIPKTAVKAKKQTVYIDAPQRSGKRFAKVVRRSQQKAPTTSTSSKKNRTKLMSRLKAGRLKNMQH